MSKHALLYIDKSYPCHSFTSVNDQLSSAYHYRIKLIHNYPLDCDALVNQPACLQFQANYRHGIISGIDYLGKLPEGFYYCMRLASPLKRLKLRWQSRIFTHVSAIDIITQILKKAGFKTTDYRFLLSKPYPKLACIIQYQETDYAFLLRITNRYGLNFTHQQDENRTILLFTDNLNHFNTKTGAYFQPEAGLSKSVGTVHAIAISKIMDSPYPLFFAKSDICHIAIGQILFLQNHPDKKYNQAYRIIASQEQWQIDNQHRYVNQLQLMPLNSTYKNIAKDPIRRFYGVWIGHIEGNDDNGAPIDHNGNYRVRLVFDRHGNPLSLPLVQPTIKMHFPLAAGTEVAIICLEGDVDKPVILGALHNPLHPSPVTKSNAQQAIIRTQSGNELCLDDTHDKPCLSLSTQNNHNRLHFTTQQGRSHVAIQSHGDIYFYTQQTYTLSSQQACRIEVNNSFYQHSAQHTYAWIESESRWHASHSIYVMAKSDALFESQHLHITGQSLKHKAQDDLFYSSAKDCIIKGQNITLSSVSQITASQVKLSAGSSRIVCHKTGLWHLQTRQWVLQAPCIYIHNR